MIPRSRSLMRVYTISLEGTEFRFIETGWGFRVKGLGFGVQGLGFRVKVLWADVEGWDL